MKRRQYRTIIFRKHRVYRWGRNKPKGYSSAVLKNHIRFHRTSLKNSLAPRKNKLQNYFRERATRRSFSSRPFYIFYCQLVRNLNCRYYFLRAEIRLYTSSHPRRWRIPSGKNFLARVKRMRNSIAADLSRKLWRYVFRFCSTSRMLVLARKISLINTIIKMASLTFYTQFREIYYRR